MSTFVSSETEKQKVNSNIERETSLRSIDRGGGKLVCTDIFCQIFFHGSGCIQLAIRMSSQRWPCLQKDKRDLGSIPATASADKRTGGKRVLQRAF